ncbi:ATP-binding protein [Sulfurimonas indica]|uniref:ATP-binding protein n=1 Tax=Sulfurimonas TaxID=202746 RepID=UPI0012653026|nr:ATP-binding protein [Sulfurimonas indica]
MNEHDFKIDDNIIYSIIQKQAGTLQKAFLELIMNSIDAEASKVEITFDGYNFEVLDDGKGFESEETIHKFFGTFGTPHNEGDSTYGLFRMGRGQIMAFSKNSWHSNVYSMYVDVKNNGTKYNLKSNCERLDGCKISGTLYDELEPFEVKGFEKELKEFIKFSQIPVYLNGEMISSKIEDIKWDIVNDDAYIKLDNKRNLAVYNLGVKVREYSSWDIGYGGIIVSKKPLEVNFARNDILKKSCSVWKSVQSEIKILLGKKSSESSKKIDSKIKDILC